jgi:hypothetical protein
MTTLWDLNVVSRSASVSAIEWVTATMRANITLLYQMPLASGNRIPEVDTVARQAAWVQTEAAE